MNKQALSWSLVYCLRTIEEIESWKFLSFTKIVGNKNINSCENKIRMNNSKINL